MKSSKVLFTLFSATLLFSCKPRTEGNELASNVGKSKKVANTSYLNYYYEKSNQIENQGWSAPEGMYLDWTTLKIYPMGDRQARLVVAKLQSIKAGGAQVFKDLKNATTIDLSEADARLNRIPLELISKHIDLFKEADALVNNMVTMEGRVYYNKSTWLPGGTHVGYFHLTFRPSDLGKMDVVFGGDDELSFGKGHGIKTNDANLFDKLRILSK